MSYFLEGIVPARLYELFGYDDLEFELQPGKRTVHNGGVEYEPGTIAILGITEPWPDASDLHKALDDAFFEAGQVETEQMKRADELVAHLRAGIPGE
jgi:hypothetical protein